MNGFPLGALLPLVAVVVVVVFLAYRRNAVGAEYAGFRVGELAPPRAADRRG
jgi:hypothetical protein